MKSLKIESVENQKCQSADNEDHNEVQGRELLPGRHYAPIHCCVLRHFSSHSMPLFEVCTCGLGFNLLISVSLRNRNSDT
jgi:hypothetical protein